MDMNELRGKIDKIDDELVQLFCQRMDVAAQIADYKKANNMPIHVPARELEKLADVANKAGAEMADYTKTLYGLLFELSRSYQRERNTSTTQPNNPIVSNSGKNEGTKH